MSPTIKQLENGWWLVTEYPREGMESAVLTPSERTAKRELKKLQRKCQG